jgi:hypothetical protein
MSMKCLVAILASTTVLAGGLPLSQAAAQSAPSKTAYKPPHNPDGTPDLSGAWSNATITPLERPVQYGDRALYTPAEVQQLEGVAVAHKAAGDAPTPKENLNKGFDASQTCDLAGFTNNQACAYNSGWTDPGTRAIRLRGEARTSLITFPKNGRIPPRLASAGPAVPEGAGDTSGHNETPPGANDNPETRGAGERCIKLGGAAGPVMRSGLYNNNIEIYQSKGGVAILAEMIHDVRDVRLNSKHQSPNIRKYFGDPIGWYEKDTLVVESTNYHRLTPVAGSDGNLKLTERFTRDGPNTLHYQFTVEDPTVWAEKWGGEYDFVIGKGVYEYACHEGNYGLENILAGQRADDAAAAAAAASKPVARQ